MRRFDFDLLMGEEIVYETGIHKIIFLSIFYFLGFLFFISTAICLSLFLSQLVDSVNLAIFTGTELFFILLILAISLPQYMLWKKSYLIVTNKRIIYRIGWIHQNVGEIILKRLIGINVEQTFWARVLNYGTIKFNGDNDVLQPLSMIADPFLLKNQVMGQIHKEDQV